MSRARELVAALAAVAIVSVPAAARTLHVAPSTSDTPSSPRGYSTIQEAVDAAADGDVVLVGAATWLEGVVIEGKFITLRSVDGPDVTRIQASIPVSVKGPEAVGTVVEGFELRGQSIAFYGYDSGALVTDCTLTGYSVVRGAYLRNGTYELDQVRIVDCPNRGVDAMDVDLTMVDCWIEGNGWDDTEEGGAIRLDVGSVSLERCVIVDNESDSGSALWIRDGMASGTRLTVHGNRSALGGSFGGVVVVRGFATVDFTQTVFTDNVAGAVVRKSASSAEATFACTVWRNPDAARVGGGFIDPVGADGNRDVDPFYCDVASGDLAVRYGSPCEPAQSGGCGIVGAFGPDCGTPGDVLVAGTIRLPDGTPLEGVTIEATGDDADTDVTGADGVYSLALAPGAIEIAASHPDYDFFPDPRVYGELSVTAVDEDFYPYQEPRSWLVDPDGGGDATTIRAGLDLAWALDTVWVAPGYYVDGNLDLGQRPLHLASVEGPNTVSIDVGNGGDVFRILSGAPVTIEGLTLEDANHAAIIVEPGGSATVRRCVIAGNEGRDGAAIMANGELVLEASLIDRTGEGGGIWLGPSFQGSISRNIIHENRGPAIVLDANRSGDVHCNALWNNDEDAITGDFPMSWGDNGNFSADPLFCDHTADLRVDAASPCLPGQDVYGAGCGLIGPYGQGCADRAPFYAFAVSPSEAGYHAVANLAIEGRHFPPGVTVTLVAEGEPDIPVALDQVESYLLSGWADLTSARPGPRVVRVTSGSDGYDLEGRFEIPSLVVTEISPDVLSSDGVPTEVTITGFPFLASVEARFVNGAGEALPVNIVSRTLDTLVLEVDPGGARSFWDLELVHPDQDELLVEDALWIEDERRVLNVPGDYATIPIAFDVAIAGDTVRVGPGEYGGGLVLEGKHLVLQSAAGPAYTTFDGDHGKILRIIDGGDVTRVEGFTFRNGYDSYWGGAIEADGRIELANNRFEDNQATRRGGAVHVRGSIHAEGNTFVANFADFGGGAIGLLLDESYGPSTLLDNVFIENDGWQGTSILAERQSSPEIPVLEVTTSTFVRGGYPDFYRSSVATYDVHATLTHSIFTGSMTSPYVCYVDYPTRDGDAGEAKGGWGEGSSTLDCLVIDTDDPDDVDAWLYDVLAGCEVEIPSLYVLDPLFCDPDADDYRLQEDSPVAPDATACGRIGALGTGCAIVGVDPDAAPAALALGRLSPNPFNPRLRIPFDVPAPGADVRIEVFDVSGRRLRTLLDAPVAPGRHAVIWDGRSDGGSRAASGLYFVRMRADGRTFLERATLLQ